MAAKTTTKRKPAAKKAIAKRSTKATARRTTARARKR
ncbi:hypothetical protein ACVWXN_003486 [Bradyrhizobium sp. i1.4.4]